MPPPSNPYTGRHTIKNQGQGLEIEPRRSLQQDTWTRCVPKGMPATGAQTIFSRPVTRTVRCSLPPRDPVGGCREGGDLHSRGRTRRLK